MLHRFPGTVEKLLHLIMKIAPIGLGAYFAYQVATIGPQLFEFYAKPLGLYYGAGIFIFLKYFKIYQNSQNTRTESNALIILISSAVYITIMLYALYREKQRIKSSK